MHPGRLISVVSFFILLVTYALSGPGCANIIPPSGGPRDTLPPVVEKATPLDSTRNFTGNKVTLVFNEFIELQNAQQQMLISPTIENFPSVEYKLNTITVRFRDSLESNTTYTINFGDAIKDFTEGNVLKNFSYTFSTGNYIDSLQFSGRVVLAENGKTDTTMIVMLHTDADDSAVVKKSPRYVTKLDNKGQFVFRNLPPKTFYIYALKDEGGGRRYYSEKQLFAFANEAVIPSKTSKPDSLTLFAYSGKPASTQTGAGGLNQVRLKGSADKRLKFRTSQTGSTQDLLQPFILTFDDPLKTFDTSRIRLYTDSAFIPVPDYRFQADSSNKVFTLQHSWKENTLYRLVLDKDFAEDSNGRKLLKSDTLDFTTKKIADYGSLKIRLKNVDLSKNPVLLILTGETIIKSYPLSGTELTETLFLPGDYDLRVLFDTNKNGKWDPGEFFGKHLQPEIVMPLQKKLSVKPAFQNEIDLSF